MTKTNLVKAIPQEIPEVKIDYKKECDRLNTKLSYVMAVTTVTGIVAFIFIVITMFLVGFFVKMNQGSKQALWFGLTDVKHAVACAQSVDAKKTNEAKAKKKVSDKFEENWMTNVASASGLGD